MNEYTEYDKIEKIYRYLDFVKFADLLSTRKLYFSRADKQNDKFEGSLSESNILMRKYQDQYNTEPEKLEEEYQKLKKFTLLSCWHRSSIESFAMWKIYSNDTQGVAIETTIGNLKDCFLYNDDEYLSKTPVEEWGKEVFLANNLEQGNVIYHDGKFDHVPEGYAYQFRRFFYKLKFFEYEKEHRLIVNGERVWDIFKDNPRFKNGFITKDGFVNYGESISVNINKLITKIIICPDAHKWFTDLVIDIVKKHGLDESIVQESMMSRDPHY